MFKYQLAEAYIIYQLYRPPFFSPMEALEKGTIFPELYRPYDPQEEY